MPQAPQPPPDEADLTQLILLFGVGVLVSVSVQTNNRLRQIEGKNFRRNSSG